MGTPDLSPAEALLCIGMFTVLAAILMPPPKDEPRKRPPPDVE
jgi:hypothetical protein